MTRASAAVTTTTTARANPAAATSNLLQRKCACGNQAGFDGECEDCRDEKLRRKPAAGGRLGSRRAPPIVHDVLRQPGAPLEPTTRAFMEARFDRSFADVRIHADPQAARSAAAVDAHAYTVGRHIAFAEGRYEPQTSRGRKLLAHELAHAAGNSAESPPASLTIAEAHGSAAEALAEHAETWVERGYPGRPAVTTTAVASPGRVQRKGRSVGGWFANVWSFIRGIFTSPFSASAIADYLTLISKGGDIEDDFDSHGKARQVVEEWKKNHAAHALDGKLKALLIREMKQRGAGKDDQTRILDLLETASNEELRFIFGPGAVSHASLLQVVDAERPRLEAFYLKRYKITKVAEMPADPDLVEESPRDAAINNHRAKQRAVAGLIKSRLAKPADPAASTSDPAKVIRNTCEWIESGRIKLVVLTPTDWKNVDEKDKDKIPYFDARVAHPQVGGDYPSGPEKKDDSIRSKERGTHGEYVRLSDPPTVFLYVANEGPVDEDQTLHTLVHELQHHADLSEIGKPGATPGTFSDLGLDMLWSRYQTEFRAFWIQPQPQRSPDSSSPAPPPPTPVGGLTIGGGGPINQDPVLLGDFGSEREPAQNSAPAELLDEEKDRAKKAGCKRTSVRTDFVNKRQEDIFRYLTASMHESLYGFGLPYVCNDEFKRRVDAFTLPQSMNAVNSLRIQDLTDAIAKCQTTMGRDVPAIKDMLDRAGKLDGTDVSFLRHPELPEPFWRHARRHLGAEALSSLRKAVGLDAK